VKNRVTDVDGFFIYVDKTLYHKERPHIPIRMSGRIVDQESGEVIHWATDKQGIRWDKDTTQGVRKALMDVTQRVTEHSRKASFAARLRRNGLTPPWEIEKLKETQYYIIQISGAHPPNEVDEALRPLLGGLHTWDGMHGYKYTFVSKLIPKDICAAAILAALRAAFGDGIEVNIQAVRQAIRTTVDGLRWPEAISPRATREELLHHSLTFREFLDVSTAHITKKDDVALQRMARNPDEGRVIEFYTGYAITLPPARYLNDFVEELLEMSCSNNLVWLVRTATAYGAKLLVMDRDGPIVTSLGTFGW